MTTVGPDFSPYAALDVMSPRARLVGGALRLLSSISPRLNVELAYRARFRRSPRLRNPRDFNEKLCWLKLNTYANDPIYARCADKLLAKEYVAEQGYPDLPVPVAQAVTRVDDLDWDALPKRCMLKWSHGYGMNFYVDDKNRVDRSRAVRYLRAWGKTDFWKTSAELQYRGAERTLLCEPFIDTPAGALVDYKLYCFAGQPAFGFTYGRTEQGAPIQLFFDQAWNQRFYSRDFPDRDGPSLPPAPPYLDEMFEVAADLSRPFPFVRIDFFGTPDRCYFAEFTFTPHAGMGRSHTKEAYDLMGALIDLQAATG